MMCHTPQELEAKNYPNFKQQCKDKDYHYGRVILSCTNDVIQQCNYEEMGDNLPGETIYNYSIDECIEELGQAEHDTDVLDKINAYVIPPHKLALKVGAYSF